MFTGDNPPRFDSLGLVELTVKQLPFAAGDELLLDARFCYYNSKEMLTFGFLDLKHNPQLGMKMLDPEVVEAWKAFCEALEKQQGKLVFGKGSISQLEMFKDDGTPNEDEDGESLFVGLGGGT